ARWATENPPGLAPPHPIVARHMDQVTTGRDRRPYRNGVGNAAFHNFDTRRDQMIAPAPGPHEGAHREPFLDQAARDRGADETARSSDDDGRTIGHHGFLLRLHVPRVIWKQGCLRALGFGRVASAPPSVAQN